MKQLTNNNTILEIYFRKYLKKNRVLSETKNTKRHYALIKTDKGWWLWANDYLNKKWNWKKGKDYNFYIYSPSKGKNKGKNFILDYCLTTNPRELKKQFRRQWLSKNLVKSD